MGYRLGHTRARAAAHTGRPAEREKGKYMAVSMTTETLLAAAQDCEDANALIRSEMNKVSTERSNALGQWSGPAANAFNRLTEAWLGEAKKMTDTVEQFHNQLTGTARENEAMEDEQQSMLDNFSAQMGI
jgi:WXG100 family type VII secretion target